MQPNIVLGETVPVGTPVLDGGGVLEISVVLEGTTLEVVGGMSLMLDNVTEGQSVNAETLATRNAEPLTR